LTYVFSFGRQRLHLYSRAESRQAACDFRPRLLTVTRSLALMVNDQDLYSVCARKQRTASATARMASRVRSNL